MARKEAKLNQVLAIEKGVKARCNGTVTRLYHLVQKPVLLNGLVKNYQPLDEDGVRYPPESQKVQVRADETLKETRKALTELFNVTAQKDWANCDARADVVVEGELVLTNVPVTYLLFLEKQLTDLKTLVSKVPVLDSSDDWQLDEASGLFKTTATQTTRTSKVQRPIVLYDATDEHPAQTQLITEDVVVGHWSTVKQSGALPADRKNELLERIEQLLEAVKFSRETANSVDAPKVSVDSLFGFIFG